MRAQFANLLRLTATMPGGLVATPTASRWASVQGGACRPPRPACRLPPVCHHLGSRPERGSPRNLVIPRASSGSGGALWPYRTEPKAFATDFPLAA